jgi:hypothetical protein
MPEVEITDRGRSRRVRGRAWRKTGLGERIYRVRLQRTRATDYDDRRPRQRH